MWPDRLLCCALLCSAVLCCALLSSRFLCGGAPLRDRFSSTLFLLWVQCVVNVVFAYLAMQTYGRSGDKVRRGLGAGGFIFCLQNVSGIRPACSVLKV